MQSSLSQASMMLSGHSLHSYAGVQAPELGKPQSNLAYQQPSSTQHIPILFEPQLNQPSGMGGSQLIDTHLLQVWDNAIVTRAVCMVATVADGFKSLPANFIVVQDIMLE